MKPQKGAVPIKRILKIVLLSLLALLVVAAAVFAVIQWENIRAVSNALSHTEEELLQMEADAKTSFEEKTGIDLTQVEQQAAGLTVEDILAELPPSIDTETQEEIPEEITPDAPTDPKPTEPDAPKTPETQKPVDTSQVERILAKLYVLQSSYTGQIEAIRVSTISEYQNLPPSQKTKSRQLSMARGAVSQVTALERQCDQQVAGLLLQLRAALAEIGMDGSIANEAENYYVSQKSITKSKYMNKYMKYLS